MARLQGLLKRPSKAEELELELARQGSVARLEQLLAQRAGTFVDQEELPAEPSPEQVASLVEPAQASPESIEWPAELSLDEPAAPDAAIASGSPQEDTEVAMRASAGVPVMAPDAMDTARQHTISHRLSGAAPEGEWDRIVVVVKDEWDRSAPSGGDGEVALRLEQEANAEVADPREAETVATIEPVATIEASALDEPFAARVVPAGEPRARRTSAANKDTGTKGASGKEAVSARPSVSRKKSADPPPPPRVRVASIGEVHPKRAPRQPRQPAVLAACPSCAVLLDPRPTASRRCSACRERIVVKRLEGGVLYLTASAAAALEAGQRRIKETARLARIRDRWLAQASAVGASPAAIERIGRVTASQDGVLAARTLYLVAAGRAFLAANRERRFAEAASIRRAHVLALVREQGASAPVADGVITLYRDAMSAELKAQREFGRDAELVAPSCCDACRVDAGIVVRISEEVKATRLPHAGCPKGICHCRWLPARVAGRRAVPPVGSVR